MNKILAVILSGWICFVNAQTPQEERCFHKNAKVISLGANVGIVNYTSKELSNGKTSGNLAANSQYYLQFEYGLFNWLGVGIKGQYCNYVTQKDTATNTVPQVTSIDLSAVINAHILRTKHCDLLTGFNFGYSSFTYDVRNTNGSTAYGGGLMYDIHFQSRFYFGKHFGIFLNLAYAGYSYPSLTLKDNQNTYNEQLKLGGGGMTFGAGLQVKF